MSPCLQHSCSLVAFLASGWCLDWCLQRFCEHSKGNVFPIAVLYGFDSTLGGVFGTVCCLVAFLVSGAVFATVFVRIPKVTLGTFSDCCFVRFGLGSRWCLAFSNRRGWYPFPDTSCSLVALCLVYCLQHSCSLVAFMVSGSSVACPFRVNVQHRCRNCAMEHSIRLKYPLQIADTKLESCRKTKTNKECLYL